MFVEFANRIMTKWATIALATSIYTFFSRATVEKMQLDRDWM